MEIIPLNMPDIFQNPIEKSMFFVVGDLAMITYRFVYKNNVSALTYSMLYVQSVTL